MYDEVNRLRHRLMHDVNPIRTSNNILDKLTPLTPYGIKYAELQTKLEATEAAEERASNSMKNKFSKIAELFEMDVLSEEEALKACGVVIQQHAKVKGELIDGSNHSKLTKL